MDEERARHDYYSWQRALHVDGVGNIAFFELQNFRMLQIHSPQGMFTTPELTYHVLGEKLQEIGIHFSPQQIAMDQTGNIVAATTVGFHVFG